jgi:hypothetical protein
MLFASGSSFRQEGNHKTALFYLDDPAVDYADYLVRKGMDVNARDARGCTPLMDQAGSGQIALVQLLLNHGAEIDAMDDHHNTPLIAHCRMATIAKWQRFSSRGVPTSIIKMLLGSPRCGSLRFTALPRSWSQS